MSCYRASENFSRERRERHDSLEHFPHYKRVYKVIDVWILLLHIWQHIQKVGDRPTAPQSRPSLLITASGDEYKWSCVARSRRRSTGSRQVRN